MLLMNTEDPLEALVVIPLAEVDSPSLFAFASALCDQPRYFGSGAVPPPSARWRAKLRHPAGVRGVAAVIAIAEHRKPAARALARRYSTTATLDGPNGVEYHSRLAS